MIKEIKNLLFMIIIILFIFFIGNYYFSDLHKKRYFRSISTIEKKIDLYSKNLPVLKNDTNNIIEYVENIQTKKKKKYYFWKLIDKND